MTRLREIYLATVIERPRLALAALAVVVGLLATQIPQFSLDASSNALLLESDSGIEYYRAVRARYGSDDYLILTYTPAGDLFSDSSIARLQGLRDALAAVAEVSSVVSILDVPLLQSPPIRPSQLADGAPTLLSERTDRQLARRELTHSPLYRNRLVSSDGSTTALQINLRRDEAYESLLDRRASLQELRLDGGLSRAQRQELRDVRERIDARRGSRQRARRDAVAQVRKVVADYREPAEIHLGGLPLINADLVNFIRHDLLVFGVGLLIALVVLLAIVFRRVRWVVLPLSSCALSVACMTGLLGLLDWPVTVVSSNFVSLMLILTLSLNVHMVVRYRELQRASPPRDARGLATAMVRQKAGPALYTALTTMVAFASFIASGIRPVIDFGWMMVIGMAVAFAVTFTWLPAALVLLGSGGPPAPNNITARITAAAGRLIGRFPSATLAGFGMLALAAVVGLARLSTDNRFIDYFKADTAIHRGMEVIDQRLGGTTPLDIVIDADAEALPEESAGSGLSLPGEAGLAARSYWYDAAKLDTIAAIQEHLEQRDDIGKVLSLASTAEILRTFLDEGRLQNFELSLAYRRMPDRVRAELIRPYLSVDGNQTRLSARIYETSDNLQRDALLQSIRDYLSGEIGIAPERVHLTGLVVLYNNVLNSLMRSQLVTAGAVTLAIWLMFAVSFRSLGVAAVAILPNLFGAALV
ncbi:MAG TPA: MMPL family transporter, partial [Woeseiaceae bacterium]|nr:MMPL family transporter [Woeseiaceae bacterium]